MTIDQVIDSLKRDPGFMRNVTLWKEIPEKEAEFAEYPATIDSRLVQALKDRGIKNLFIHQAEAIQYILDGYNTVVVTPTASGKTLCYNIPVLNAVLETREARALYLFPTKALSQDQMTGLQSVVESLGQNLDFDIKSYTFDGDTPQSARKAIRSSGHIVVTNPDMLHSGIMPHHTLWVKLFENLKYIVIDEIHHYRGVFGSHLANVVRRLKRICIFYGSNPVFICCSATISNPRQLGEHLTGEPMKLVDKNGAPQGNKHFILYNPPVVNKELGIRRSYIKETRQIASRFITNMLQTIVFLRSRMSVEILLIYLKEAMHRAKKPSSLVHGYRGGYLPSERRAIERGLRDGSIIGVVSTNALELGIDIGQLQICLIAGYPGTIASTLQQAGRAGRRLETSLAIMVASSSPLDQYIVNQPDYLFSRSPEAGIVDPDNLLILLSHIKCAAFELPFTSSERFGAAFDSSGGLDSTQEILEFLQEKGVIHRSEDKWHWMTDTYPAEGVSLRSAAEENVVIIDKTTPQEKVIGEIDLFAAQLMVHDDAIYLHGGQQYHVDKLDWERRKAYINKVEADHYTDAQLKTDLKVLEIFEQEEFSWGAIGYGEVRATSLVTMFKKVKFHSHENVGWGKVNLPEIELHTMAFWYQFPVQIAQELHIDNQELGDGLKAVANVLHHVVPLFVMGDPRDFNALPMVRAPLWQAPTVFIWELYPGGVGFSKKLYHIYRETAAAGIDLIRQCGCNSGCPSCVGPVLEVGEKGKSVALLLLKWMQKEGEQVLSEA
ncbi:DEAD/DEAH box helicase [candidate division KSB1 bacterium]|nr:DEAD/DEAH box helicase [candidate division KSB1 bacterium]